MVYLCTLNGITSCIFKNVLSTLDGYWNGCSCAPQFNFLCLPPGSIMAQCHISV